MHTSIGFMIDSCHINPVYNMIQVMHKCIIFGPSDSEHADILLDYRKCMLVHYLQHGHMVQIGLSDWIRTSSKAYTQSKFPKNKFCFWGLFTTLYPDRLLHVEALHVV